MSLLNIYSRPSPVAAAVGNLRAAFEGGEPRCSSPGLVPIALGKPRRPRCGLACAPDTGFYFNYAGEIFNFRRTARTAIKCACGRLPGLPGGAGMVVCTDTEKRSQGQHLP